MYRVKLIKGISYDGIISATIANPVVEVEDKATADAAIATGYFELVSIPEFPKKASVTSSKKTAKGKTRKATAEEAPEFTADYGE